VYKRTVYQHFADKERLSTSMPGCVAAPTIGWEALRDGLGSATLLPDGDPLSSGRPQTWPASCAARSSLAR
jgi:hypothetical protein